MTNTPNYETDDFWLCSYEDGDPTWKTNVTKEGWVNEGEILKLEMCAKHFPPGTMIKVLVPCCPDCGDPATLNEPDDCDSGEWPDCKCGHKWTDQP